MLDEVRCKSLYMCAENVKMKSRKVALITIAAILFAASATVALSLKTEDAFAREGRYSSDTSQAAAVSNDCLNPLFIRYHR